LTDGRPIRLGSRACDVLMALIEASGAVVGKDELLSRVWQGRIVDQNRQSVTRFSTDRADRHERVRRASIGAGAGSRSRPSCTVKKRSPWLSAPARRARRARRRSTS